MRITVFLGKLFDIFLNYTNVSPFLKAGRGGQIVCFQSAMPTIGGGALGRREEDESTLYGTDKEKALFIPRNSFWRDLGEECTEEGIGVSLFVAPTQPMDLGSIGEYGLV
jgi:protein transport protein SEC24